MAAAAPLNPNSKSSIDTRDLSIAINALLKHIKSNPKHKKSQLFEPDDILYLLLTLNRIPSQGRTNPHRIPIPNPLHPFNSESTSICVILDDRSTSSLLPDSALELIRTGNLPIQTVIGLSQLESDYKPYESRRKLCDSYDLFFADRKILPLLPRLLGKHFFKRKKIPLAVDFSRAGWAEQIKSWCGSSLLYLRTGTCCGLKIGRVTMSVEEILENALVVIEKAMEYVPKGWGNLRSVHVKTCESVALPVYQAIPEVGMRIEGVLDEKEKGKRKKNVRNERERRAKKAKKGRIGDASVLFEVGDAGVGDEAVSEMAREEEDGNAGVGDEAVSEMACEEEDVENNMKEEKKRKRKKNVGNKEENDGMEAKEKKGKKAKKVANEENGELGEKSLKKKVGGENVDVALKKCKSRKKGDDLKVKKGKLLKVANVKKVKRRRMLNKGLRISC